MGLNRGTQAVKQTGSSMKPLSVVAPGIDSGKLQQHQYLMMCHIKITKTITILRDYLQ